MSAQLPEKRPAGEATDRLLEEVVGDADMPRPLPTWAGTLLILLRVVAGAFLTFHLSHHLDRFLDDVGLRAGDFSSTGTDDVVEAAFVSGNAVQLVVYLVLAVFIFAGSNWARVVIMVFTVLSISVSFATWIASDMHLAHFVQLLAIALDILILLALSSRDSAAYAQRRRRT